MSKSSIARKVSEVFKSDPETGLQASMLYQFFIESLQDIYWAEKQIVKTLPKMEKAATSQQLKMAFSNHLEDTHLHVQRLEKVFEELGETARGKKCEAIEGIIAEGKDIISDTEEGTSTRDVGLIFAAQKVEHYEIATYGGLAQFARALGQYNVADILQITLEEEKSADILLSSIAENDINYVASAEDV